MRRDALSIAWHSHRRSDRYILSFQQGRRYSRQGGNSDNHHQADGRHAVVDAVVEQLKYSDREGRRTALRRHDEHRGGQLADGDREADEPGGGDGRPALRQGDAQQVGPTSRCRRSRPCRASLAARWPARAKG